jgi:acyl-coenzyme A synthetase/AMP-(fatty) acid ligase/aryl carrier-like protein
LVDVIKQHQITHVTLPPVAVANLSERAELGSVRTMILAGDAPTETLVRRWADGRYFINAYGPTEATVWATLHQCHPTIEGQPPIGRPIANTMIYLLDSYGQPVPVGVVGEIYIGGAQVARGYLNRPELTAERFVPDSFVAGPRPRMGSHSGSRMYKTGDLSRYRPDGNIEFLGRNDFQVKIRGFRIELGEIEARLVNHAAIREAVVLARGDGSGGKRLVAYYTGQEARAEALRTHLSSGLPEHMIPSAYIHLETLPLSPNGKLDRRALPAPEGQAYVRPAYEPPVGEIEARLARIWADILNIERVGRHDNYFELGGHSLLAVSLIERMRQEGLRVDVRALFTTPILSQLAAAMEETEIRL